MEGYLLAAISSLAGVIAVLWASVQRHTKDIEKRLNDCEEDRSDLWEVLWHLTGVKKPARKATDIASKRLITASDSDQSSDE